MQPFLDVGGAVGLFPGTWKRAITQGSRGIVRSTDELRARDVKLRRVHQHRLRAPYFTSAAVLVSISGDWMTENSTTRELAEKSAHLSFVAIERSDH